MRGSALAPAATASRSAQAPAQKMAWPASCRSLRVGQTQRHRVLGSTSSTSQPVSDRAARVEQRRGRSARATAAKSTIPVLGECRAAIPRAWGSSARDALGVDAAQAGDAVGGAPALELLQAWEL